MEKEPNLASILHKLELNRGVLDSRTKNELKELLKTKHSLEEDEFPDYRTLIIYLLRDNQIHRPDKY